MKVREIYLSFQCPEKIYPYTRSLLLKNRVWTPEGFQSSPAVYNKNCVPTPILDFPKGPREYGRELSLSGGNSIRQSISMMGSVTTPCYIILPHQNTTPGPLPLSMTAPSPTRVVLFALPERAVRIEGLLSTSILLPHRLQSEEDWQH
ncbi:hypothetical protein GWK47_037475 [Chionoecetes opilio]|uniref:Uncharacterized protein n=1 Tax=Chionoecetes opilio TaxID=41210 RepID=A0A8J4YEZ0_CHIOP|nr:hypothetical protein GWK47_037475 [Chionoecetes opilio]